MRLAGGILVGLGLMMVLVSVGTTILGMQRAYQRAQSGDEQPSPAESAGDLQGAVRFGLSWGARGVLIIVPGVVLLILGGIMRGTGRKPQPGGQ